MHPYNNRVRCIERLCRPVFRHLNVEPFQRLSCPMTCLATRFQLKGFHLSPFLLYSRNETASVMFMVMARNRIELVMLKII
jgi:hypothetical protein